MIQLRRMMMIIMMMKQVQQMLVNRRKTLDFSTNTQKLSLAEQEFQKVSTDGNQTITWDESITIIQRICTSCSKKRIEEVIYETNSELNEFIPFDYFIQAVRRLLQEEGGDDTQVILPDETNVNDRLVAFANELLALGAQDVTVDPKMMKELQEKYNLPPPSST